MIKGSWGICYQMKMNYDHISQKLKKTFWNPLRKFDKQEEN